MHYKLYLVCQIREHMTSTSTGPEQLREAAWAQLKWDDEKVALDEVRPTVSWRYLVHVNSCSRASAVCDAIAYSEEGLPGWLAMAGGTAFRHVWPPTRSYRESVFHRQQFQSLCR